MTAASATQAGGCILRQVRPAFDRRLAPAGHGPLAVAFSGGGDSLACLLAARAWAHGCGRAVVALSVDHGLQAAGAAWVRHAEAVARELGCGFQALAWTGEKPAAGLSAAARAARHRLLAEAARGAGAKVLLLGHTADDVLEAGLMREAGSNVGDPSEWSPSPAWPEGRGLFLFRPLLSVRRPALREMMAGQAWIEDPANADPRSARARARRQASSLHHAAPDGQSSEGEGTPPSGGGAGVFDWVEADAFGVIRIGRAALCAAAPAAARRLLARACVCAGGGDRLPRTQQVARLLERIGAGEAFAATLAGSRLQAGEALVICRDAGRQGLPAASLPPGGTLAWDGRYEVAAGTSKVELAALRGKASHLPAAERRRLAAVPAAARATLPVILGDGETVTCPLLAEGGEVRWRSLVPGRLLAACGWIERESQLP